MNEFYRRGYARVVKLAMEGEGREGGISPLALGGGGAVLGGLAGSRVGANYINPILRDSIYGVSTAIPRNQASQAEFLSKIVERDIYKEDQLERFVTKDPPSTPHIARQRLGLLARHNAPAAGDGVDLQRAFFLSPEDLSAREMSALSRHNIVRDSTLRHLTEMEEVTNHLNEFLAKLKQEIPPEKVIRMKHLSKNHVAYRRGAKGLGALVGGGILGGSAYLGGKHLDSAGGGSDE